MIDIGRMAYAIIPRK